MAFAILRAEKLHQKGQVAAASAHLSRERECKNADDSKRRDNEVLAGAKTTADTMARWQMRLDTVDRKVRADAVTCIEMVITGSPEWYATADRRTQGQYHKAAVDWVAARFGRDNIIQAVCHRDEKTPHLHLLVTPIATKTTAKGKTVTALCAKSWLDGSGRLSEMQTAFAREVGGPFGLSRGIEGSVAHHKRVKSFYGTLARKDPAPHIEVPKKGILEPQTAYAARAATQVYEQIDGWAVGMIHVERDKAQKAAQVAAAQAVAERERVVEGREKAVIQREADHRKAVADLDAEKRRVKAQEEAVAEERRRMVAREAQMQDALRAAAQVDYLKGRLKDAEEEAAYYLHTCPIEAIQRARQEPERPQAQRAPERRGRGMGD